MNTNALSLFAAMKISLPDQLPKDAFDNAEKMLDGIIDKIAVFKSVIDRRLVPAWRPLSDFHRSVAESGEKPEVGRAIPIVDDFDANFDAYLYIHSVIGVTLTLSDLAIKTAIELVEHEETKPQKASKISGLVSLLIETRTTFGDKFGSSYNALMTLAAVSKTIRNYLVIQNARNVLMPIMHISARQQCLIASFPTIVDEAPPVNLKELPVVDLPSDEATLLDLIDKDVVLNNLSEITATALRSVSAAHGFQSTLYHDLKMYLLRTNVAKQRVEVITDRVLLKYHFKTMTELFSGSPMQFQDKVSVSSLTKKYGSCIYKDVLAIIGSPLNISG
jgi:hypothetical protein